MPARSSARRFLRAIATLTALPGVVCQLPSVELAWRVWPIKTAIEHARQRGRSAKRRGARARGALRRAVALVDRVMPGEPTCYRRVLLEMSLDAGAAAERVHIGLRRGGGRRSGHIWLDSEGIAAGAYDIEMTV